MPYCALFSLKGLRVAHSYPEKVLTGSHAVFCWEFVIFERLTGVQVLVYVDKVLD